MRYGQWILAAIICASQWILIKARERDPLPRRLSAQARTVLVGLVIALVAALVLDSSATWEALQHSLESGQALAITLGAMLALFPCGVLIGRLTQQWARAIESDLRDETLPHGLEGAGRAIGWLERAAIYFALVLGRPEAVAVVFTAKSIARFPSFQREAFAEYYLIGTLLSVLAGAGTAVAVRLVLGWSAL